MYLPLTTSNNSIAALWSALLDRTDNRTDNLPMMDSIVWPIGLFSLLAKLRLKRWQLHVHFALGIGLYPVILCLTGFDMWFQDVSKFMMNDCILIPYYSTELFLESIVVYLVSTNILWNHGNYIYFELLKEVSNSPAKQITTMKSCWGITFHFLVT